LSVEEIHTAFNFWWNPRQQNCTEDIGQMILAWHFPTGDPTRRSNAEGFLCQCSEI
jgi:hypothetical protein